MSLSPKCVTQHFYLIHTIKFSLNDLFFLNTSIMHIFCSIIDYTCKLFQAFKPVHKLLFHTFPAHIDQEVCFEFYCWHMYISSYFFLYTLKTNKYMLLYCSYISQMKYCHLMKGVSFFMNCFLFYKYIDIKSVLHQKYCVIL